MSIGFRIVQGSLGSQVSSVLFVSLLAMLGSKTLCHATSKILSETAEGDKSIFQMYMHEPIDICLLPATGMLCIQASPCLQDCSCEYGRARLLSLSPFLFVRVLFYTASF